MSETDETPTETDVSDAQWLLEYASVGDRRSKDHDDAGDYERAAMAKDEAERFRRIAALTSRVEALEGENARFALLKQAVNESTTECLPGCDSHGHEGECPGGGGNPARWLIDQQAAIARLTEENQRLRDRLRLVNRVCYEHHEASLVTWDGVCPVCTDAGGAEFYEQNAALYRAALTPSSESSLPASSPQPTMLNLLRDCVQQLVNILDEHHAEFLLSPNNALMVDMARKALRITALPSPAEPA